ncbi:MAG: DUF2157 domain-containing protein [Flavobacteriaceae bacterium]|jgi:uncharacterized membrane protein|nr:DUF2157 domain-containing protein [Flavobacteriaceae bacterium]
MKKKFDKEDLFHLYHSSDLTKEELKDILKREVYSDKKDWNKFIEMLFLILGAGLLLTGILFFFAYNWTGLPKFLKFGIIGICLTIAIGFSVYHKISNLYKRIALLCSSVLVGVLYAVFGQEYQTGANAYDFFLAWLLTISVWSITSKFPFQWLFYGILANITLMLCFSQIYDLESVFTYFTGLLLLNILLVGTPNLLVYTRRNIFVPNWYTKSYLTVISSLATLTIGIVVFSNDFLRYNESKANMYLSLGISILWIGGVLWRSLIGKTFYAYCNAVVSCYFIVLILLMRVFEFTIFSTFLYAIYLIGGTFGLVNYLITTFKKWHHE